jgi:hypothetical protein
MGRNIIECRVSSVEWVTGTRSGYDSRVSDPFNILGPEFDVPPTFEEAAREAVEKFQSAVARFTELYERIPEESFTEEEWRVVEVGVQDLEAAVERAEEGYVAVQFDGHAWYRIMESLETVTRRLESTIGLMTRVLERTES